MENVSYVSINNHINSSFMKELTNLLGKSQLRPEGKV